jgi:hypothetical protein
VAVPVATALRWSVAQPKYTGREGRKRQRWWCTWLQLRWFGAMEQRWSWSSHGGSHGGRGAALKQGRREPGSGEGERARRRGANEELGRLRRKRPGRVEARQELRPRMVSTSWPRVEHVVGIGEGEVEH